MFDSITQPTVPDRTREAVHARCWAGVEACRRGNWEEGVETLYAVVAEAWLSDAVPSVAYSYLGYGRAAIGDGYKEGLRLCRVAVKRDAFEPENYLNLARTCLLRERRRLAISALNRGLRVSPRHPELLELRRELGLRRRPAIPFLSRSNPLNRELGKLRNRRAG